MLSTISLYAVTHENAPLDVIGRLEGYVSEVYERLLGNVEGVVVLATCNRFEVYVDNTGVNVDHIVMDVLGEASRYVVKLTGVEAVRHLFEVASGLKSQIIGEYEILGQVRRAWITARTKGYTSELLDKVFHRAIIAGRRAREETRISHGVIGYPQAAIELLSRALNGLNGRDIMVVGAGHAAEAAMKYMCEKYKPKRIIIVNRTPEKALRLTRICDGSVTTSLDDRFKYLEEVDGIFIAVSGGVKLLSRDDILRSKAVIVDISIPQTIDIVEGKTYTIDDVRRLSEESLATRLRDVDKVKAIIEDEMSKLYWDLVESKAKLIVSSIMRLASNLSEREVARTLKYHGDGSSKDFLLRVTLNSYTKKILRPLVLYIRDKVRSGDEKVVEELYSYFLRELGGERS